jgi:hypothetical protein
MTGAPSVEDLVLGHVLDARRRGRGGGAMGQLGTPKERQTRALLRNAGGPRGWQSVVRLASFPYTRIGITAVRAIGSTAVIEFEAVNA